jgi:hypothetical protein
VDAHLNLPSEYAAPDGASEAFGCVVSTNMPPLNGAAKTQECSRPLLITPGVMSGAKICWTMGFVRTTFFAWKGWTAPNAVRDLLCVKAYVAQHYHTGIDSVDARAIGVLRFGHHLEG